MKGSVSKPSLFQKSVRTVTVCIVVIALFITSVAAAVPSGQIATLPNGLRVDKWMLQSDGQTVADYLGQTYSKYGNKKMQEMINFIYVDPYATSSENANNRFYAAIYNAEPSFSKSSMHSGGYTSYLEDTLFTQMPDDGYTAYVDKSWYDQNIHHFRTFGAVYYQKAWYITVAASTENFNWLKWTHTFNSFNSARDVLLQALLGSTKDSGFKQLSNVNLQNKISSEDSNLTTADFDGVTVCVQAPAIIHS